MALRITNIEGMHTKQTRKAFTMVFFSLESLFFTLFYFIIFQDRVLLYIAQTGLELDILLPPGCLNFEIIGKYHHTWLTLLTCLLCILFVNIIWSHDISLHFPSGWKEGFFFPIWKQLRYKVSNTVLLQEEKRYFEKLMELGLWLSGRMIDYLTCAWPWV